MFQPARRMVLLLLLAASLAHAAPPPTVPLRQLTLGGPEEPLPTVRMGLGVMTVLLFDAPMVLASVQADATLVKVVDGGERSLLLTLLRRPAAHEQPTVRVRYADGASPEWATFALQAPATEVDLQVHVRRRPQPLEACQSELAQARARCDSTDAGVWEFARRLGEAPVTFEALEPDRHQDRASGLIAYQAWLYQAGTFWLLVLTLENAPAGETWVPTEATWVPKVPKGKEGLWPAVPVRTVSLEAGPLAPGTRGRLAVETDLPPAGAPNVFTLTVRDRGGRQLTYEVIVDDFQQKKGRGR
ncbi:MAG TPA: DUF2381 family protein [Myxococcaceae bacterium]